MLIFESININALVIFSNSAHVCSFVERRSCAEINKKPRVREFVRSILNEVFIISCDVSETLKVEVQVVLIIWVVKFLR